LPTIRSIGCALFLALFLIGCAVHQTPMQTDMDSEDATAVLSKTNQSDKSSRLSKSSSCSQIKPGQKEEASCDVGLHRVEKPDQENAQQNVVDQEPEKAVEAVFDDALEFCQISQNFWQKGDLEKALEALDQAYSLILNVNTDDTQKVIQQKEDLRFMISKRILEIYASRNIVVNGNHKAIPIKINHYVQAEIDSFTKGAEKGFFIESYKRSGIYRQKIVEALEKEGLPSELSWLPLIESGFKTNALSKARALGLWQFIPSTGYKFGLDRDTYIDERLDPEKSTHAAIAYMKELHGMFGDWTTVLAAYNCGEGRVLRVIREQNINYLDNFWDLYERLPQETARYVPRFLATIHIVNHPKEYGLDKIVPNSPYQYDTVSIDRHACLKDVADAIGTDEYVLTRLNPELRQNILPKDNYPLKVPCGKKETLLANIDSIPTSPRPSKSYEKSYKKPYEKSYKKSFIYHRVKAGETLSNIASRYRTSVSSITRANNLTRKNHIMAGQRLKIPKKGTRIYPEESKAEQAPRKKVTTHVVKRGDSLFNIAKRYETTIIEIQELNGLKSTALTINQSLKIPGAPSKNTARSNSNSPKTHQVKNGETPFRIATKYNITLNRLYKLNNLTSKSRIFPGQMLLVE